MNKKLTISIIIILGLIALSGYLLFYIEKTKDGEKLERIERATRANMASSFGVSNYGDGSQDPEIFISNANINGYNVVLTTQKDCFYCADFILEQKLELFRDGELKYEVIAYDSRFLPFNDKTKEGVEFDEFLSAGSFVYRNTTDINNNKIPELSFYHMQGKYDEVYVIELDEDSPKVLFQDNNVFPVYFTNEDNDDLVEIEIFDDSFFVPYLSSAGWVAPKIVFSYDKEISEYIVDPKKMRRLAPSREELENKAKECDSEPEANSELNLYCKGNYSSSLGYILELIYSGNTKSAKEYLDLVWRDNKKWETKDDFIKELKGYIKETQYYKYLSPGLFDLSLL